MRGPGWGETRALDDHPDRVVRALVRVLPEPISAQTRSANNLGIASFLVRGYIILAIERWIRAWLERPRGAA